LFRYEIPNEDVHLIERASQYCHPIGDDRFKQQIEQHYGINLGRLLDFISRLAALVPKPRVNLTRYHGVFAPNSQHRALVTPARRGRGHKAAGAGAEEATQVASRAAMSWAQRLKRVFNIDIETCRVCGGSMRVIACIEDPLVIKKILTHLRGKALCLDTVGLPKSRAPPQDDLFS